ncbi:hypothetical protein VNO78_10091 [Psophocarpus tetragonolobus]|uniref:Uncharacterized protein n=1 Tax=Psophocarpus tetragonolobus TaxID=3891 RepID=A0AAN9XMM7_PSOTE
MLVPLSSYPLTLLPLVFFSSLSSSSSPPLSLRRPLQVFLVKICGFKEGTKRGKMNSYYGYQEKNTWTSSCEEMEMEMEMEMRMESLICPKPRRLPLTNHASSFTHPISLQSEVEDSGVGAELLDIILPKENFYLERSGGRMVASPPPYFCGSPPSRASNPLIQDEQFGNGNFSPFTEASSSSARGCVPMKFGHTPAAVRIEGFDCLNRDRSSCSISAVA